MERMSNPPERFQPSPEELRGPDTEDLVELSLEEEGPTDLQALADEVAESTEDPPVVVTETFDALDPLDDLQQAFENAQDRIKAMEEAQSAMVDQHRRLAADFSNFRTRASRDNQMAVDLAEKRLLLEILQVLDNFERGLGASYPSLEAFRDGIELIHKHFLDTLRRIGVAPIEIRVGDPFDASFAEALTTIAVPDLPDHSVASVFERGFRLREHLLRPARVVVNHQPSSGKPSSPTNPSGSGAIQ
jgi:molecular chaperone GrpE